MNDVTTIAALRRALAAAQAASAAAEESWYASPADEEDEHVLAYARAASAVSSTARAALAEVLVGGDHPRAWTVTCEQGAVTEELGSLTIGDARRAARAWAEEGDYDTSEGTLFLLYRIHCAETGEDSSVSIELQPEAPACVDGDEHDWQAPHELLGGLEENPGVWGHGGGVIVHEVCMRCGCGQTTDTWAQDPTTGRQGLTSVRYEPGKHLSALCRLEAA
ncbi:MAG: hypothetical protein KF850_33135 [Labilithrix sp.]|nr:hypothetical protein [Labilithrix sp.]MBX3216924.1 hypothetical protein [Labilithrix sp.]